MIPVEKVSDGRLHAPANNTAARNRYRNFIVYFLIKKRTACRPPASIHSTAFSVQRGPLLKIGIQKTGPFRKNVCRLPIGVNKIRISSFPVGIISVARLIDNPIIENAIKNRVSTRLFKHFAFVHLPIGQQAGRLRIDNHQILVVGDFIRRAPATRHVPRPNNR